MLGYLSRPFSKGVPGDAVADFRLDLRSEMVVYPAMTVIMMGQKNATGELQYLHRRMQLDPPPYGAGVPHHQETRKDRPFPNLKREQSLALIYLDGMTEGEIRHWDRRGDIATEGKIQQALQAAYQAHGVPSQPEKSHGPALQLDTLETLLDGAFGGASTPRQFDVELLSLSAWILGRRTVTLKHLQIFAGRWSRKLQHKREASCVLYAFWKWFDRCDQGTGAGLEIPSEVKDEIVLLMLLMPLMHVDMRLQVSHLAVCTDASERGGGLCYSTGLTRCGGVQACALACDHEWVDSRRMVILDLNAGVGSLRQALDLLKVQPRAHVVTERNCHARAVLSARWPDATFLDSSAKLSGDQVKELLDAAPGVTDWIVVCAISHQQATASASQLSETTATLQSLSNHFKVHVLAHGSVSKRRDINEVSGMLGLSPVLVCPQRVLPCRHPTRLWASWPLKADSSMSTWRGARGKVRKLAFIRGERLPTSAWATPGWAFQGPLLPPFMARPSRKRCRDKFW